MNIHHLEYFLEVVREGNFSKAAAKLHITQPTISKVVQNIEEELGIPLIYRSSKHVELTDAGKVIVDQVQQIVLLFQNLTGDLENVASLKKGVIRIGIPPITSSTVLPRVLGEFSQLYPNIQLKLHEFGSKRIKTGVREGTIDIGIACNIPSETDTFEVFPLIKDPLHVIVHPSHRLAKCEAIDFKTLAAEAFVLYNQDFSLYDQIIHRCKQAGFHPRVVFETSQREFMTEMVASNLGIALLPSSICQDLDRKFIVAIPLTNSDIYLQLAIIWRKDRYLSFAARRWLEFTTTRFRTVSE